MVQSLISSWLKKPEGTTDAPRTTGLQVPELAEAVPLPADYGSSQFSQARPSGQPCSSEMLPTALPGVPPNVQFVPITDSNVDRFRRLISLLLPIPYPDSFFRETLEDPVIASVSRAALWHVEGKPSSNEDARPQLVAAIRCRLLAHLPNDRNDPTPVLYISTIATLAPFRGHSLATCLLQEVAAVALHTYGVRTIMGHVWEANDEAMEWYKRRGFRVVGREEGYYKRLAPRTAAWIIRKDIDPQEAPTA